MTDALLHLELVSKRYRRPSGERIALDGVSLEVRRGQMLGVFGASGAGKTTLLRIATGLQAADGGSISYDGERLDRMSASERKRLRRREIACVWAARQSDERLGVLDHVEMPLLVDRRDHRAAERRAREALLACEAEQCIGMELRELSDGERQRVEIARALVIEPRLLLADGPASSLSLVEQEAIMVLLGSLAHEANVAVLIAERDAKALIGADPLLYLRNGRLIGSAPAAQSGSGNVYRLPLAESRRAAADA